MLTLLQSAGLFPDESHSLGPTSTSLSAGDASRVSTESPGILALKRVRVHNVLTALSQIRVHFRPRLLQHHKLL